MSLLSIGAVGTETKGASKAANCIGEDKDENKKLKTAYMGPNIGNLLNGSAQPPTASAFQA